MTHSIFKVKIVYFLNWLLSDKRIVNVCFIMKDYGLLSHLPTALVIPVIGEPQIVRREKV